MSGETKYTVLGAGTILSYEDPSKPDDYIWLEEALKIGTTGQTGTFVEDTPISSTSHRYRPGMDEAPDKEFVLNDVPGISEQEAFLDLAEKKQTINMKVELVNGRVGKYTVLLNNYVINEPEAEGVVTVTVYGKQIGKTVWSKGTPA